VRGVARCFFQQGVALIVSLWGTSYLALYLAFSSSTIIQRAVHIATDSLGCYPSSKAQTKENRMVSVPDDFKDTLYKHLDWNQISDEAANIIIRVHQGEPVNEQELDVLLNPTEAAAVLSAKYKRSVNHRYIKEMTRQVINRKTGHITPARLAPDKVAGRTHLYKASKVLAVHLRQTATIEP
jgi:hypothetical protein